MSARQKQLWVTLGWLFVALLFAWVALRDGGQGEAEGDVERLFREQRSGVVIEVTAVVSRVLPDDLEGSRHQRFIVRLDSGHTLLVSHNIDLASRVESLARDDEVTVRGQYEWNERGGIVHWTHHDPEGRRQGGWVRHGGRTYR